MKPTLLTKFVIFSTFMQKGPIQGTTKRLRPGLVNKRRKICVPLPAAGRRTQFFHLLFTKPGRSLLVVPCSFPFAFDPTFSSSSSTPSLPDARPFDLFIDQKDFVTLSNSEASKSSQLVKTSRSSVGVFGSFQPLICFHFSAPASSLPSYLVLDSQF